MHDKNELIVSCECIFMHDEGTYCISYSVDCSFWFGSIKNPLMTKLDFYVSPTQYLQTNGENSAHLEGSISF